MPIRHHVDRARGFTLLELLVALTLGGIVILLARAVFAEVGAAAARGIAVARDADRAGNRRAWLVRAFGSADVGSLPQRGFVGRYGGDGGNESADIAFQTRIALDSGPVLRRVRVARDGNSRLIAERAGTGNRLAAGPDTVVLGDSVAGFGADYLVEYGERSRWVREWISPVSAPVAVRLRVTFSRGHVDTLLLHIGPRG